MNRPSQPPQPAAKTPDGFTSILGAGRGTGSMPASEPRPLTLRERVRLMASWVESEDGRTDRLDRIRDENKRASELGLQLTHGRWREFGDYEDDIDGPLMLTLVHDMSRPSRVAGIIDADISGSVTLHLYDDPAERQRALR